MAIGCERRHKDSLSNSDESSDENAKDSPNTAKRGGKDKDGKRKLNKKGSVESNGAGIKRQATKRQRGVDRKGSVEFGDDGSPDSNNKKYNSSGKQKNTRK